MTVSIHQATPDEAATLAAVAAETFPLACPPTTSAARMDDFIARHLSVESMSQYLADPARVLFLASVHGETAGYAMLVVAEPVDADVVAAVSTRPTAELSKLYVRERFHGHQVAPRLVAAALDTARDRGALSAWLGVNQFNARANRFYEKSGFALVGTKRFLVGDRYEDDFVRELQLR